MPKPLTYLITVCALGIGLVAFWYLVPRSPSFGMFASEDHVNVGRFVLAFAATILGVVLGSLYRKLRAMQQTGVKVVERPSVFFSEAARSVDLWLALVGAPIVYALLLQSTSGMALPGMLIVALQNGFCCVVIVNSVVAKTEAGHAGPTKPAATKSAKSAPPKSSTRTEA